MLFLIYIGLPILILSLIKTGLSGRETRIQQGYSREIALEKHRYWSNATTFYTIILVVLIEVSIRIGELPPLDYRKPLFICHMISNVFYFGGLLTARYFITGLVNPPLHRVIVRITLVVSFITIATGIVLLN